ncbi:MAG: acyl carrier protein [Nitritalea sp.]
MHVITQLRQAIRVFSQYGIPLNGEKKYLNLYHDLRMDDIYVNGLIYELELKLQKELPDEQVAELDSPIKIVRYLLSA